VGKTDIWGSFDRPPQRSGANHWPPRCTPALLNWFEGEAWMPKPIGYAVVGTGDLTRHGVLPAFTAGAENSRVSAIVGSDRTEVQAFAQPLHAAAYHLDEFRQCLNRDDVHAVCIALPNSLHSDYTVDAARAGKHVLCDRPMAVTADECRRMIRTCQTNRV